MNFNWLKFLFLIALFSCEQQEISQPYTILGHGGAGFISSHTQYPKNTFESVQHAVENLGAEGVEIDIQMTADSVLYLYHNLTLDDGTNCSGVLSEMNSVDIEDCQVLEQDIHRPVDRFNLVTLTRILNRYNNLNQAPLLSLDISSAPYVVTDIEKYHLRLSRKLTLLLVSYNHRNNIIVESSQMAFLQDFKAKNPDIKVMHNTSLDNVAVLDVKSKGLDGIISSLIEIEKDEVEFAHENNLSVMCYGLKTEANHIKALDVEVDIIQTDNILLAQSLIKNSL